MTEKEQGIPEKQAKKKVHAGHRKRVRERFYLNGFDGFANHEILEVLLYYTNKTKNTNEMAHDLLNKFHMIDKVLSADPSELLEVKGVGEETVFFFKVLSDFMRVHSLDMYQGKSITSFEARREYFFSQLWMNNDEVFLLTCLDDKLRILSTSVIARGTPGSVKPQKMDIVRKIVNAHCNAVMIAHNHPVGSPMPSAEDIDATKDIANLLWELGVTLEDHIIVGDGKAISMKQAGCFFT